MAGIKSSPTSSTTKTQKRDIERAVLNGRESKQTSNASPDEKDSEKESNASADLTENAVENAVVDKRVTWVAPYVPKY